MGYVNGDVFYDTLQPLTLQHSLPPGGFVLNSSYSANPPALSAALNGSDVLQKMAEEAVKKKTTQDQGQERHQGVSDEQQPPARSRDRQGKAGGWEVSARRQPRITPC